MNDSLLYKPSDGKPPKFIYSVSNILRMLIPNAFYRYKLKSALTQLQYRSNKDYIEGRVNYYNELSSPSSLSGKSFIKNEFRYLIFLGTLADDKKSLFHTAYFFDTREYTRWFKQSLRWGYYPGDVYSIPEFPSIVKSRLLTDSSDNSVVIKLDKFRHFVFVNDTMSFSSKKGVVIFRGKIRRSRTRRLFLEMYMDYPMCDCGVVGKDEGVPDAWTTPKRTIRQHLDYKFIMALEGNGVASNLKWVMSSNSIVVMPRPTCETRFMEGKLIPNYRYTETKPDFTDLEERLKYYIGHPEEAQQIIEYVHEYMARFRNPRCEKLISLLVLDKHFRITGQNIED